MGLRDSLKAYSERHERAHQRIEAEQLRRAGGYQVEMMTYPNIAAFNSAARLRIRDGWRLKEQSQDKRRVAVGRKIGTAAGIGALTFGLGALPSLLIPQRKSAQITVTWERGTPPVPDPMLGAAPPG